MNVQTIIKYAAATILVALFATAKVHAESVVESNQANAVFKADGKVVSAVDAAQQAKDHEIERCTPIKGATSSSGQDVIAYKCKLVVLAYNPKTGTPHWKAK